CKACSASRRRLTIPSSGRAFGTPLKSNVRRHTPHTMHSIRKPRVFLSHSKKDVDFIRKLDFDLRAAQCDPWLDEIELRSGQPWLDQIFSSGIPSCEIVLCYIIANYIDSE